MKRVVLFGDSVFAGHGLKPEEAPSARLSEMLPDMAVSSVAAPDRTSADGLARVEEAAGDIVLVEFGLNDAVEGIPPARTEDTLKQIVEALRARGAAVVVVEALVPLTSRWPALTDQGGVAARAATTTGAAFVEDILRPVTGCLQDDGLHPTAAGAASIARRLARAVEAAIGAPRTKLDR